MKAKHVNYIKDPCDLPLCTHLGYAYLHTIRQGYSHNAIHTRAAETTKCNQLQNKSL